MELLRVVEAYNSRLPGNLQFSPSTLQAALHAEAGKRMALAKNLNSYQVIENDDSADTTSTKIEKRQTDALEIYRKTGRLNAGNFLTISQDDLHWHVHLRYPGRTPLKSGLGFQDAFFNADLPVRIHGCNR